MPQINIVFENTQGRARTINCEVVPRIGERLELKGMAGLGLREPDDDTWFVCTDVKQFWEADRLIPTVYLTHLSPWWLNVESDLPDDEKAQREEEARQEYLERVYRSAEEEYLKWPPFG